MSPPTIIDVANACNVSASTVSLVISDHPRIPALTKEKIRKKIAELGYRPNPMARSLVSGRTGILAVLVPPAENVFSDPFYAQALDGIYSIVKNRGYRIILEVGDESFWAKEEYRRLASDRLAEGVIFLGGLESEHKKLASLETPCRYVVVGEGSARLRGVPRVSGDNFKGGLAATECLLKLGHKNIAHIHGDIKVISVRERLRGYQRALFDEGVLFAQDIVVDGRFREWDAYLAAKSLLSSKNPPTAIFAGNDLMAFGAIRAATSLGLGVPGDVSVVGMDDIPAAADFSPPLTTVKYPVFAMGSCAASALIDSVENDAACKISKTLDVALVVRKSAAEPAVKSHARKIKKKHTITGG